MLGGLAVSEPARPGLPLPSTLLQLVIRFAVGVVVLLGIFFGCVHVGRTISFAVLLSRRLASNPQDVGSTMW